MYKDIVTYIRKLYNTESFIPLHEPRFYGNERKYVMDAIDSTFVSSVGEYVNRFETMMAEVAGTRYAVATVNGTASLHIALILSGVKKGTEVITQPLTFVATANAITYTGAVPVFVDVDKTTLGLSPDALRDFLENKTEQRGGFCINKNTGRQVTACVPMHTFGFPCRIDKIVEICNTHNIQVVEDAAESIGSKYKGQATGSFGNLGIFSFNGNKTVTCGGGGAITTNDEKLAKLAKHITTTAKVPHKWEYIHDMPAYNYRMPNLNAAMACAQLEQLDDFIKRKRTQARKYADLFEKTNIRFLTEEKDAFANYWLMSIVFNNFEEREKFLTYTNEKGVMTRPIWKLMHKLAMYKDCEVASSDNAEWLEEKVVNIPSSVISNG